MEANALINDFLNERLQRVNRLIFFVEQNVETDRLTLNDQYEAKKKTECKY